MDKTTERELLKACSMGDRVALGTLVTHYEKPIYNAAYRMLGDENDAADVAQTTFVKAFERLDRYDPKYRFFSWIYRIAVNESIDQIRRRGKTQQLVEDQLRTESGPAGQLQSDRISSEVQNVLMTLQEDQRAVIVLRYFATGEPGE